MEAPGGGRRELGENCVILIRFPSAHKNFERQPWLRQEYLTPTVYRNGSRQRALGKGCSGNSPSYQSRKKRCCYPSRYHYPLKAASPKGVTFSHIELTLRPKQLCGLICVRGWETTEGCRYVLVAFGRGLKFSGADPLEKELHMRIGNNLMMHLSLLNDIFSSSLNLRSASLGWKVSGGLLCPPRLATSSVTEPYKLSSTAPPPLLLPLAVILEM
ncbi:hypothetical protein Bca4012_084715 [Brassica carinata]